MTRPRLPRAVVGIALAQSLCFAAQLVVVDLLGKPYDIYLALSAYGMRNGHGWEIVTALGMHAGPLHFAVNLLGIVLLGSAVAARIGSRATLWLYLGAGLTGAIAQAAAALLGGVALGDHEFMADRFGGPVVASSTGLFAWWALLGTLPPRGRPAAVGLALGVVALWAVLDARPEVAHVAHFVGLWRGRRCARAAARPALQND